MSLYRRIRNFNQPAVIDFTQLELDRLHHMEAGWYLSAYLSKHGAETMLDQQRMFESWTKYIKAKLRDKNCVGRKNMRMVRGMIRKAAYPQFMEKSVRSICLFMTESSIDIIPLKVELKTFVNVSDQFYLVPLYSLFADRNRYWMISVIDDKAVLYDGRYHHISEIASVDLGSDSGVRVTPMVALAKYLHRFVGFYDFPVVVASDIKSFDEIQLLIQHDRLLHCPVLEKVDTIKSKLHHRANAKIKALLAENVANLFRRSAHLVKRGQLARSLGRICRSARQGIVDELFLAEDLFLRGKIREGSAVPLLNRNASTFIDQQLAASVYNNGGNIYHTSTDMLSSDQLPILATLR